MITYKVVQSVGTREAIVGQIPPAWSVVAKESGVVVAGPFAHKGMALAEANLRASMAPGNRVES